MLEHGFSSELERKVAPLYQSLISRLADGKDEVELTPTEYCKFCYFVAIQYTRVSSFRDKMALFMKIRGEQLFEQIVESQSKEGLFHLKSMKYCKRKNPR